MIMNPNGVVTQVMMKYKYSFAEGRQVIAGKKNFIIFMPEIALKMMLVLVFENNTYTSKSGLE